MLLLCCLLTRLLRVYNLKGSSYLKNVSLNDERFSALCMACVVCYDLFTMHLMS